MNLGLGELHLRIPVDEPYHLRLSLSPETKQPQLHAFVVLQLSTLPTKLCFGQMIHSRDHDVRNFPIVPCRHAPLLEITSRQ
ncbi:hypothetical protein Hdeb2414_s0010g00344841 [Helianthus debilis subsp. tardiflorus]